MMDYEQEINFFEPSYEFKLYDTLTIILNLVKKTLALVQKSHINKNMLYCIDQFVMQIRKNIKNCKDIADNFPLASDKQYQSTVQRFICRLLEILISYRHKYVETSNRILIVPLLKQIETVLVENNQHSNFPKTLRKICSLLSRHIDRLTNQNTQSKNDEAIKEQHQRKIQKRNSIQSKSETYLSKVVLDIKSSFKLIGSLDIDFSSYKQTFLGCKNNNSQLFKECMLRNALIAKQIARYSQSFRQYMLRKKNRPFMNRKNRFTQYRTTLRNKISFSPGKKDSNTFDATKNENNKLKSQTYIGLDTVQSFPKIDMKVLIEQSQNYNKQSSFQKNYLTKEEVFGEHVIQKLTLFGQTKKANFNVKKIHITTNKINIQNVQFFEKQPINKKDNNKKRMSLLLNNKKKEGIKRRQKGSIQVNRHFQQTKYLTAKYIPLVSNANLYQGIL